MIDNPLPDQVMQEKQRDSENQILQHGYKDYSDQPSAGWSMTCDEVILQIDLTYPVNTCMRPFIPNYDD